jgi:hypothetical protein
MTESDKQVTVTSDSQLKQRIIEVFKKAPSINRRELSVIVGASYGTTRNVISKYIKGEVTKRGRPSLPFSVHGWYWSGLWRRGLYESCPAGVVEGNLNGMKRFFGGSFSFILHKGGRVAIYPFVDDEGVWRSEVLSWLQSWVLEFGLAEALLKEGNLKQVGSKSWAVHTPGVPGKICFRVKGIGSLKTDPTPYPDGTSEFELDPQLDKRLRGIEGSILSLVSGLQSLVGNLQSFTSQLGLNGQVSNGVSRDVKDVGVV